jgi:hypothetical protein
LVGFGSFWRLTGKVAYGHVGYIRNTFWVHLPYHFGTMYPWRSNTVSKSSNVMLVAIVGYLKARRYQNAAQCAPAALVDGTIATRRR